MAPFFTSDFSNAVVVAQAVAIQRRIAHLYGVVIFDLALVAYLHRGHAPDWLTLTPPVLLFAGMAARPRRGWPSCTVIMRMAPATSSRHMGWS